MNLEVDRDERDTLIIALGQLTAINVAGIRDRALDLLKRLAVLMPEPDDVDPMDFGVSGKIYCPCVGKYVATVDFAHKPGCPWVARYGS